MQSGRAGTAHWVLEYQSTRPQMADPLMGWIGNADTQSQVKLIFPTQDEAVAYADRHGIAYDLELPHVRRIGPKAYADNFRFGRKENWTH